MAKKSAYDKAREAINQDFYSGSEDTYQGDQETIDEANKALKSGSRFQSEVERDTFMKASPDEKKKIVAEALAKKRKGK